MSTISRGWFVALVLGLVGGFTAVGAQRAAAAVDDVFTLTTADDTATLRPHSPGRLELVGPTFVDVDFPIPTTSLTVDGGLGVDSLVIEGSIDLGAASLVANFEQVAMPVGAQLVTTGDVTISAGVAATASNLGVGPLPSYVANDDLGVEQYGASATTSIALTGASIDANSIALSSESAALAATFFDPFTHTVVDAAAEVAVHDSTLTAQGDVTLGSAVFTSVTNESFGAAGELNGPDGAIASVDITVSSQARLTGSTVVNAGGALSIEATNEVEATGSGSADAGTEGGGVSLVRVSDTTRAYIDTEQVEWTATSMTVDASTDNSLSSAATSSAEGSDSADQLVNYPTPSERTEGEATAPIAGALSFLKNDSTVEAYIQGDASITTTGPQNVEASSRHNANAIADGSTAALGGTGVGNAIGVNIGDVSTKAWLAENADLDAAGGLTVQAAKIDGSPDTFDASALPGDTGVIAPPSLQVSDVSSERLASIGPSVQLAVAGLTVADDVDTTSLTLEGVVVNDDEGTAIVTDWSFTATGASGVPGSFDLSQIGPDGYERTSLTCDDGPGEVESVALAVGDEIVCTFVNDDVAPPAGLTVLAVPCVVYDSDGAGELPFVGGESRSVQVTGVLSGQGGAGSCVPSGASSVVFTISSIDPLTEGNLLLTPAGVAATGAAGVVNYGAANGLNNANTVTVPVSSSGAVDIEANTGPAGAVPTTDVRLVAIGYYSPDVDPDLKYFAVNPCPVADSRTNQGANDDFDGPDDDGLWPVGGGFPDVDVLGVFPAGQGGGQTDCGVPDTADAVLLNVVAVNMTGGSGHLSVGTGGSDPIDEASTPFAVLTPKMNNGATTIVNVGPGGTVAIDIDGDVGASTMIRVEVLGYYDQDDSGFDFFDVTPCAVFDTRSGQGAANDFEGLRKHGVIHTTVYQVAGDDIDLDQGGVVDAGGGTGSCGVPDGASAVLINLEGVNAVREGNFWVSAAGTTTTGGVLNFNNVLPKMNNANAVVVPLNNDGELALEVNAGNFTPIGTDVAHARGVILGYYS